MDAISLVLAEEGIEFNDSRAMRGVGREFFLSILRRVLGDAAPAASDAEDGVESA